MKIEYEIVKPDKGSSFRLLHHKMVRESDFVWQFHYHPEYEIVFVPQGSGTRHVGNHLSTYHQGDLVLIGSNLPHSGFGLNSSGLHEEIVLQVKPELIPLHFTEMDLVGSLLERARYGISFSGVTREQVGELMATMVGQPPFKRMILLLEILEKLAGSEEYTILNSSIVSPALLSKHKARLQKVFSYVEKEYAGEVQVQKAAALVGLSVPSFCNFFKKTTQITFSDFVNQYRIQKSCMLLHQDKSISEVCFECGFNNVTYFNRLFKQVMNETPSAFKKKISGFSEVA
ncbi:helix-turn-helix domain-containing protein [Niabella sp. CJ426]|jgi:AraC-like DNA-binding protein|uniref:helix-turn-helix domain-containing protein n=1 Tax=Niabella sp. CJ426 TaxID=3393740 RepID=UPI003D0633B0